MKKKILASLCVSAFILWGCSNNEDSSLDVVGLFNESSPGVEQRFADSQAFNTIAGFATVKTNSENYRVFVHTDTHIGDKRDNLERFIHLYRNALDCPFAIHLGDMIDAQNHWDNMSSAYTDIPQNPDKQYGDTLFVMAGNHDIYFNQWEQYKKYWKTSSYYFIAETPSGKRDLFLILDSAEGSLGANQMDWFKEVLEWADTQNFRHKVVCSHTHLFKSDGSQEYTSNFTLEETYELMGLLSKHNVDMYWSGHDHFREVVEMNGVTYIVVDALVESADPAAYMVATMGEKIGYEFCELPR